MSEPPPPDPNLQVQPLIIHNSNINITHPSSMVREYQKGNWTIQETLILITAKKLDDERRLKTNTSFNSTIPTTTTTVTVTNPHDPSNHPSSSSNRNSGELRWKWVENYCWSHGCLRSQNQCNDKWDNLLRDYKKVRDYESKSLEAHHNSNYGSKQFPSYWNIEKQQRKERKLPSNMVFEVYQAVTQVLQRKLPTPHHHQQHPVPLLTSPSPLVTTQPLLPPPPPPQAPASSTTPVVSEGSESTGTEYSDDNSESKRRKVEFSIMRSASELARTLGKCEKKKEKRHRQLIELQQRRLYMEQNRNQMNHEDITNLVSSVTNLSHTIKSLVTSMLKR